MKTRLLLLWGLIALCLAGCAKGPEEGGLQKIRLTIISGYSQKATFVRVLEEFWIPEVTRRVAETGEYEIEFVRGFGTVVKSRSELEGTQAGIGDIGVVVSAFHADKLPLAGIAFVTPFVTTDLMLNAQTYDELTFGIPAMKDAWTNLGLEFLGHMGAVKTYAVLSSKPIHTIEDFEGLKIGGAGLNLRWIDGVGAIGVTSSLTKLYNEVQTGVTDAMIAWADSVTSYKFCEVAPFYLNAQMGAVTSFALAANQDSWDRLPTDVQNIIRNVTAEYRDELSRQASDGDSVGLQACEEQGGTIFEMPADERVRWAESLPNIAKEWAEDLDSQGLPGTEVLETYMQIMRANNQPIARQWDKD